MIIINSHTADNDVASFDDVSNSVILNLNQGDVINLGSCSSIDTFYKGWETSFSGFLLQKD